MGDFAAELLTDIGQKGLIETGKVNEKKFS